ncbi:hypothetical protein GCM10022222_82280 [Amycolatopsis ultiminotia]|uniref:Uncharacterized protein n=1 Tax=Amycolatopsis ultiminotia TaxID=543629 RepID=A0ABP6YMM9_9PSEU
MELGVYRHDRATNRLDVLREPAVRFGGVTVPDRWARSEDGTSSEKAPTIPSWIAQETEWLAFVLNELGVRR